MKKVFLLAAAFGCFSTRAQDCKTFLFMTDNAQVQMKSYDEKGREIGTLNWTISDVKPDGDGYTSTVHMEITVPEGEGQFKSTGTYKCNNGVVKADIRMTMLQTGQMQDETSPEIRMENTYVEYPYNMAAGQDLKNAEMSYEMRMMSSDMEDMEDMDVSGTAEIKHTNRRAQSKESVTTPAGTWEAYKITYNFFYRYKSKILGIGVPVNLMNITQTKTEWFVPGIGVVKTEIYNKKGKLESTMVLTSIKK